MNFARALPVILGFEGGFVNDPQDPGGITNLGITKGTYEAWVGHPVTIAQMQALKGDDVAPIYKGRFWDTVRGDELPNGVDLIVFDCAVNQGVTRAKTFLQTALAQTADSVMGPMTMAAVKACDPATIIDRMRHLREAHYRGLPTFDHFGSGWINRLNQVEAKALEWAKETA